MIRIKLGIEPVVECSLLQGTPVRNGIIKIQCHDVIEVVKVVAIECHVASEERPTFWCESVLGL